jgi:small basic protein
MWLLAVFCLLVGLVLGFQLPVMLPLVYTKYMSIAVLAALDSVFGGIRAYMEDSFDYLIFPPGFLSYAAGTSIFHFLYSGRHKWPI